MKRGAAARRAAVRGVIFSWPFGIGYMAAYQLGWNTVLSKNFTWQFWVFFLALGALGSLLMWLLVEPVPSKS